METSDYLARRRQKSSLPLILGIAGAGLVTVGLAAFILMAWPGSAPALRDSVIGNPDHTAIRKFLERHVNDPSTLEIVEILPIETTAAADYRVSARASNAMGALVLNDYLAVIENGEVVEFTGWEKVRQRQNSDAMLRWLDQQ